MNEPCGHDFPRRDDICVGCHQPLPGTLTEAALRVARALDTRRDSADYCLFCCLSSRGTVPHYPDCPWLALRDALAAMGVELTPLDQDMLPTDTGHFLGVDQDGEFTDGPVEHVPWQSYVRDELEERGWGEAMMAKKTQLSIIEVDGILMRGEWAPHYAVALEKAFGVHAQTWRNLFLADLRWEAERGAASDD